MKRLIALLFAATVAGLVVAGCSKSSDTSSSADATATGPVTDAGSNGLRSGDETASGAADTDHGKQIFAQNCSVCHGAAGAGGGIGPVLKGEKAKKDLPQTIAWIKNPQPPMPKLFPSPLSEKDVADVAAYVQSL